MDLSVDTFWSIPLLRTHTLSYTVNPLQTVSFVCGIMQRLVESSAEMSVYTHTRSPSCHVQPHPFTLVSCVAKLTPMLLGHLIVCVCETFREAGYI